MVQTSEVLGLLGGRILRALELEISHHRAGLADRLFDDFALLRCQGLGAPDAASADCTSASIFFLWASISFSVSTGNLRSSASFVNMLVKDCHCSAMVSSNMHGAD
jgi:hypothetical protein